MYRVLGTFFVLLAIYCSKCSIDCSVAKLDEYMRLWNIIPDVLDEVPPSLLWAKYNDTEITPGMELLYKETLKKPQVTWQGNATDLYILYFTGLMDRDLSWVDMMDSELTTIAIPTGKVLEYVLWLVTNIPGNLIDNGTELQEYTNPPMPLPNITERYLFLLFKQRGFMPPETMRKRKNDETEDEYTVRDFRKAFKVDPPIAGNFFYRYSPPDLTFDNDPNRLKK